MSVTTWKRLSAGALLALFATLAAELQAAPPGRWSITAIPALGSTGSDVTAANNRGEVVGYSNKQLPGRTTEVLRCFVWDSGNLRDIGTPAYDSCRAMGINDRGTVVAHTGYGDQAYLWKDGQWTFATAGFPRAINRFDHVVGQYFDGNGFRGFLWRDGVFFGLGTLGGNFSTAVALNDKGHVVGTASVANGALHAFVYREGAMLDLGTLGGEDSVATDINNRGLVVGHADIDFNNNHVAFIADVNGGMRPLLDEPGSSFAAAINDRGAVVGRVNDRAFLLDDGVLTYLEDIAEVRAAGWTRLVATDVTERGWIVGQGLRQGTTGYTGFVLAPR